jgi:hypothetical protein
MLESAVVYAPHSTASTDVGVPEFAEQAISFFNFRLRGSAVDAAGIGQRQAKHSQHQEGCAVSYHAATFSRLAILATVARLQPVASCNLPGHSMRSGGSGGPEISLDCSGACTLFPR